LFRSCLRRLDEVCEEIGRDRDQVEVSVQFRYPGDPSETVERVAAYRESGAGHVLVGFSPPTNRDLPPTVAAALGA